MQNVGFATGSLIKGRWTVLKKIGQGAFGEIFSGKNIINGEQIAIKVEKVDTKKQVLRLEVAVLKKLQLCPYVCRFITCGRHNDYNYMVMELLGENLSELRRRQSDGKFSLGTTLKLGVQMIQSLQAVHDLGYLHRDVKPSNFAVGLNPTKRSITYLIDFGLARRFVLASGEVRPARESTGFRGTARYASINSHLSKDLGRRDDLWSIFYVLIEFAEGQLPWRKLKDKDQIGEMKQRYYNTVELVKDLPPQFTQFMKHLKSLNYEDRPNYLLLQTLLNDCYASLGLNDSTLFDWEVQQQQQQGASSSSSNPQQQPRQNLNQSGLNHSSARLMASPSTVEVEASATTQLNNSNANNNNNNNNNNNKGGAENDSPNPPLLRRDSASVSQIANSSESNNKESAGGSWNNQKSSSPRNNKDNNHINHDGEGSQKHLRASNNNNHHSGGGGGNSSNHHHHHHHTNNQNHYNNQPIDKVELSNQQQKSSTTKCCTSKCNVM